MKVNPPCEIPYLAASLNLGSPRPPPPPPAFASCPLVSWRWASMYPSPAPASAPATATATMQLLCAISSSSAPKTERTLLPSIHSIPIIPDSTSTSTTCGTRTPPRAQRARDRASEVMRVRVSCVDSAGCRYFLGKRCLSKTGCADPSSFSVRYALYTFCASHQSASALHVSDRVERVTRTASAPWAMS